MRILLVDPAEQISVHTLSEVRDITGCSAYMPNLALPTLAALVPEDIEVVIVDESVQPVPFAQQWDLVGITGYITDKQRMFEIADEFRRRGQLVAIGGPYASLSPETVRPHTDILFVGEAETTFPEFFADFCSGCWKKEYRAVDPVDINASPVPNIGLLQADAYHLGIVQTSRGCPFECEFCDVIVYLGRRQRYKTPARIVEELELWYLAGHRFIFLSDDNFTANRRNAREIMLALREWNSQKPEPVQFGTQLSIDVARDGDLPLLDLCAEAGLKIAFIGIETPNAEALREVKKRQNLLSGDLLGDVHRIQGRGILVEALMMTGFDADSTDTFRYQFEFLQFAGAPIVVLSMLNAPEGTPLEKRLRRENRLKPWAMEDSFLETNIIPAGMSNDQLRTGTIWLWNRLYQPRAFLERLTVLSQLLPKPSSPLLPTRRGMMLWRRIRSAYQKMGPEFQLIPQEAFELFREKDLSLLAPILTFYKHNVCVLQKWGVWDPALSRLDEPVFEKESGLVK